MSRRVDLTPAARRLVREFGRQVLAGRLRTGMALPTLRTLAAEKRLSVFPVQQALKYIERQGWAHRPENGRGLLIADDALVRARELLEETPPPVINLVSPLHGRVHLEHVFMAYIPGFSAVFPRCSIRRVYVEPDHAIDTVTQLLHENATLACEVGYVLAGMVRAVMEVLRFQEAACVVAGFADPETNLPCVYEDMNEIGSLAGGLLCRTEPVVTLYERELVGAEVNLIDGFRRAARKIGSECPRWETLYVGLSSAADEYEPEIERLLSKPDRPQGIFALRPEHAMTVVKVARRIGITIPTELQVIGYNHSPMYTLVEPGITSIGPKSYEGIGRCCAELLADSLGRRPVVAPRELVVSTLIERTSTLRS